MSDLLARLESDLVVARKAQDKPRTLLLSTTLADIKNRRIELQRQPTDEDVVEVLRKGIKKRRESIELYAKGGRQDLVDKERTEVESLEQYLPPAVDAGELRAAVRAAIAAGATNLGAVMGKVLPQFKGRAEGSTVSAIAREELGQPKRGPRAGDGEHARERPSEWQTPPGRAFITHRCVTAGCRNAWEGSMNRHALGVLEFPRVLELVAARATSAVGAARVRESEPRADRDWVEREHARVAAVRAIVADEGGWAPEPVPDLVEALARLRIAGVAWTGVELLAGATLLRSSRRTREVLRDDRRPAMPRAVLAPLGDRLVAQQKAEDTIVRAIADDGLARDGASPLLGRLRRDLRGAEGELVRLLERLVGTLDTQHQ